MVRHEKGIADETTMTSTTITTAIRTKSLCPNRTINKKSKRNDIDISKLNFKQILFATITLSIIIILLNPIADQANCVEGKKLNEKKILKSLVKGLIVKNLSTKKNFLPMPVPIPVPIELSEPPVYLKGKPKYVNVYKPAPQKPIVKPTTVYHMPVYSPTYEYMMDPSSLYGSMLLAGGNHDSSEYFDKISNNNNNNNNNNNYNKNNIYKQSQPKQATYSSDSSGSALGTINFTDYDDESGNYYIKNGRQQNQQQQQQSASNHQKRYINHSNSIFKRIDLKTPPSLHSSAMPTEEAKSSFNDNDDTNKDHLRVKRQIYHQSTYEGPCYGFPLEVNIKSRVKMDRLFPIHGNSQYKKCIKVGRPLMPPVEDDPPYS